MYKKLIIIYNKNIMRTKENNDLTSNQEMFVNYLIQGYTQRQAYKLAFPKEKESKGYVLDNRAYELFHREQVYNRYKQLKQRLSDDLYNQAVWTKERAMYELIDLLDVSKKEAVRYEEAYIDEMDMYDKQIQEREQQIKHPKGYLSKKLKLQLETEIDQLKMAKIRCNRKHQANKTVNESILSSIQQLNQMVGISQKDKDEINIKAQVNIVDDVPEDDDLEE